MFIVLIYCISLSILQITGVSISWNSPASRIYSSINSKSVPIYNGHLQQQSSIIQPFSVSGGTLTSLNKNQFDNLEMSSNRDFGLNTNKFLVSQDGQLKDNNGDGMSEYTITNTRPSEINGESSQSSTKIQNLDIPVQVKRPELSSIYHGINRNSETSSINDVSKLYESSGADRGFQLGKLDISSGSIIEDGTNISGGKYRKASEVIKKTNTAEEMKDTGTAVKFNGLNLLNRSGELNEVKGEKNSTHKVERGKGVNENKEEGRDRQLNGSFGSIRFNRQNEGGVDGSGEAKERHKKFSGSNGSIRFDRKNKDRISESGGKEEEGSGFSGLVGSMQFGRQNEDREGGSGGEEEEGKWLSGSKGSIRFGGKNDNRFGGSGGEEGGIGFSGSKGSIRFGGKNDNRFGGSGGEEGGIGFSGSKGSIRFGGKNDGKFRGSGGGNIKIGEGRIARKLSKLRDIGKVNRRGEKRNFGGSVGGIQFSKENGDKELNKSNTVNIKMNGGNYGSRRFGGNIKSNAFGGDSGMSEVTW